MWSRGSCSFCPDGTASYSYAVTDSFSFCVPCYGEAEICSFSWWSAAASRSTSSNRTDGPSVVYDFSENPTAAFQAFQNLLTNPMIPKLKPGFWGQPESWQEKWQKPEGSSSSSGSSGTIVPPRRKLSPTTPTVFSEDFELLPSETIANYSGFRGFRIYVCVDQDTCLGTALVTRDRADHHPTEIPLRVPQTFGNETSHVPPQCLIHRLG